MNEKRSSYRSRSGVTLIICVCLTVIISIALYLLSTLLPSNIRMSDLTSKKVTELDEASREYIEGINEAVEMYLICTSGNEDTAITSFLDRVCEANSNITLSYVDPIAKPAFITKYSDTDLDDNSLIVVSERRAKVIKNYDLYTFEIYDVQNAAVIGEYAYSDFYTLFSTYSAYFTAGIYTYEQKFNAQSAICSAIDYVLSESIPSVYTLSGHGESSLSQSLTDAFLLDNIEIRSLILSKEDSVPQDAECVIINAPAADITESELEMLRGYIANGGNIMLLSDYTALKYENLMSLTADFDLSGQYGYIYETNSANYMTYEDLIIVDSTSAQNYLGLGSYVCAFATAHPILVGEDSGSTTYLSLFTTHSTSAFCELSDVDDNDHAKEDVPTQSYTVGVMANTANGSLTWISTPYFTDETVNTYVAGGNNVVFVSLVEKLCEKSDSLSIASKSMVEDSLVISTAQAIFWSVIIVGLIPCSILAIGLIVTTKRRRAH